MLPKGIERGGELTGDELRSLDDDVQVIWMDRDDYGNGDRAVVTTVEELRAEDREWGSGEGDPYCDGQRYFNVRGAEASPSAEMRNNVDSWWNSLSLGDKVVVLVMNRSMV